MRCSQNQTANFAELGEMVYIGFSGSVADTFSVYSFSKWNFTTIGRPPFSSGESGKSVKFIIGICVGIGSACVVLAAGVYFFQRVERALTDSSSNRKMLEMAIMPEFISYNHPSAATKQFSDR